MMTNKKLYKSFMKKNVKVIQYEINLQIKKKILKLTVLSTRVTLSQPVDKDKTCNK